jgi:hypothetical protein
VIASHYNPRGFDATQGVREEFQEMNVAFNAHQMTSFFHDENVKMKFMK